jgi:hypothetical protein
VKALLAVYGRGEIRIQRFTIKRPIAPPQTPVAEPDAVAATESSAATQAALAADAAALERTRV